LKIVEREEAEMSTVANTALRLVPPLEALEAPAVVAEILADGTIRTRSPVARSRVTESRPGWTSGVVSNGEWIMWWERRSA
jgi:hypothetical protein